MSEMPPPLDLEAAVRTRYGDAARTHKTTLCCPVSYNTRLWDVMIERDYRCGDPSKHLRAGETMLASKGQKGACLDLKHAVIYRGPWRQVQDRRGMRTAVCEKMSGIHAREPYRGHLDLVQPYAQVPLDQLTTKAGPVWMPGAGY